MGNVTKLCDFGLAKFGGLTLRTQTKYTGTINYMAPEVRDGNVKHYNNRVDIYSLGVIANDIFHIRSQKYVFILILF